MCRPIDLVISALTAWREDRSSGFQGMTAVLCVIRNRVNKNKTTYYHECVKAWAFSSISAAGDPELSLWPAENDPSWLNAQNLAEKVIDGNIADITGGSTLYYAPKSIAEKATITLPDGSVINWPVNWKQDKVTFFGWIGDQVYFIEK